MTTETWKIAVDAPLVGPLSYLPPTSGPAVTRGMAVSVPLGQRKAKGLVLGPAEPAQKPLEFELKAIHSVDSEYPVLPEPFVRWLEWVANYYVHPVGMVAALAYPPLPKKDKVRKTMRPPVVPLLEQTALPELTSEQNEVLAKIDLSAGFSTHLLFGVTGSGKTEVYLRLLQEALSRGQQGLVLVPEISLTPQLVHRFASRFGDQVAVLHSQLTDREKTIQWWNIIEGHKKILIGARSALFCPIPNLGLIIVDEEHESSFKQDEKLKYHARDAAIVQAKERGCPVILGSATPSLESWKNALDGKYQLHRMRNRVENRSLPDVHIVDMRHFKKSPPSELPSWMSPPLFEAMKVTLDRQEQVALFLNRRGTAGLIICPECGFTHECPNCDICLTLHGRHHLVCHYCDFHEVVKEICPDCKEGQMSALGVGTEQLEQDVQKLFPTLRVARADRDEIQGRADLENLISNMEQGNIDILVGTQMIAKGLDFPKLTLVGLVLADIGFNLPDFRSTERSFQLITQVSGRAGRHIRAGEVPGQVLIQTLNPDHVSLAFSQRADFEGFASQELVSRRQLNYPPYGKLTSFRIQGTQLTKVQETSRILAQRAHNLKSLNSHYEKIEVLGPAEAAFAKLRGQHRYHLLLKGDSSKSLNPFCQQLLGDRDWIIPGVRVSVDVDPLHLL